MAFKSNTFSQSVTVNPAAHFKTLTKRQFPDVMPHQKEMLEEYAAQFEAKPDVALQLPTGSGKTLVGLLVADWRRIKYDDRAVYLCPTRQLVRQTVLQARNQYGIDVVDLSGSKNSFSPADRTAYMTGAKVAISTYSGLFNSNPFFENPDLIVIDDAHAAENYIAKMWSLEIEANSPLHTALAEYLRPYLDPQDYSRLTGDWMGAADATWVEKLPSPLVAEICEGFASIVDAHVDSDNPKLYYPWSLIRNHLHACHIYLASREILIRPLIPPASSHAPFENAKQRIYMSATLGAGGDLERLTGRKSIDRLPAPEGFQSSGVGRRFFVFPSLSLTGDETDTLRLDMQKRAGRSVILTPSTPQAEAHAARITNNFSGCDIFMKDGIEADKAPFVESDQAVAILANRYDGIDFPGDECRLLCLDGLPRAMNSQERFIMSKMGAAALYNERVQTRVLQAAGRCTRALQDRSTVFITGTELVDFLADSRQWKFFHPELQAELAFGVDQSTNVEPADILENFNMFMDNNSDWAHADQMIRTAVDTYQQAPFPAMEELSAIVKHEVIFQEALWNNDDESALASARTILGGLNHPDLRGYRALWHYLAGSAALRLSEDDGDGQSKAAQEQFEKAKKAAPSVSWLNTLARIVSAHEDGPEDDQRPETLKQVELLEKQFLALGTATNAKFEKRVAKIQKEILSPETFETAQVDLGKLLGFSSGNDESDAAPDPWWLGEKIGVVFEDHADGKESTVFGATKARQASSHPKWIKKNVPGTENMEIFPVLVTPCTQAKSGADPQLDNVRYWALNDYVLWVSRAVAVLRELKGTFPGEGDLVWRAEAEQKLEAESLTLNALLANLPMATSAMKIVA
ncbi:Helicase C-terminal domain-containing protein [Cohaesibacter marisflavi]|uniref:Helicase C-terminal domain-containing protein n=1 Tax=Cohaesibacter marisflavi TaxID=655353 RepID=A0A1I5GY25_9HYPH|nr:DEAD/DEAH box helicase [Cohaesibacter marisflavi]SFO40696.1 Helicase C-terminal domain-containing protein [Cohaesibacter marisflavi]